MFPLVVDHFDHPTTIIRFLTNYGTDLNGSAHYWNGQVDDYVRVSLGNKISKIVGKLSKNC